MSLLPADAFSAFSLASPLAVLLHPALLAAGAAAAAVPIIIHLLNRRRVRPQPWAAMTWLLAALKKHQRRLKMENWLILALRTAALLLLGLGLSRWILSDSALAKITRPKRSVVLLLDTSYSTGAKDGARAVSDRVRDEADKVLSALGSDDTVAVVVSNDVRPDRSGARPAVLATRGVGRDGASRAKQALGGVRPTEAPAPWADALLACSPRALLQDQDVNRILIWITDLQAGDWRAPASRDAADPLRQAVEALRREGVDLEVIDVGGSGSGALSNLCVSSVAPTDATDVFVGHGFQLRVGVVNYGSRLVEGASLRVFLDDAPAPVRTFRVGALRPADATTLSTHEVTVPVDVPRELAFTTPGSHVVRAEIAPPEADPGADSLGLDSRRFLALDVRARLRVAAWIEPGSRSRYDPVDVLRGIFVGEGAGDVFDFEAAHSEEEVRRLLADPMRVPGVLILGNRVPRGSDLQREIGAFVSGGGALMVFSGDDFDEVTWNAAYYATPATRLLPFRFGPRERKERREDPWAIDFATAGVHPLSQAFVTGDAKFVRTVPLRLYGRTRLLPPDPATPRSGTTPVPAASETDDLVVLRFVGPGGETGLPALVEGARGLGRVLYMGTSLDDDWNPAAFALFLPVLLNDAALDMTRSATTGRNLRVGGSLRATLPKDATNPRLSIPGRGEEVPSVRAATTEDERPEVVYDRVGTSGAWHLTYERPPPRGTSSTAGPRKVEEVFGVDPDPAEGMLLRADHAAVAGRVPGSEIRVAAGWQEATATREEATQGEVTSWVLFLVALILLIEPYLAMRFGRHGPPAGGPVAGDAVAATASPPPVA